MKLFFLLPLALLAGCATPKSTAQAPLTPAVVGSAFAGYAVEESDRNGDKIITEEEWIGAGGTAKSFAAVDANRDGRVTFTEVKEASSSDKFFAFAEKTMDLGGNTELTPKNFRSPAGAKLLSFPF